MTLVPAHHRCVALDTAPLIYFLQGHTTRAAAIRGLLQAAHRGEHDLIASTITELELLVAPKRTANPAHLETIRALLDGSPRITILDVTRPIARQAATLRAQTGLRLADALVAATALHAGCTALVSNNLAFRRLTAPLDYRHLDDHLP